MTDKILIIHVNKETQEYSSYESYSTKQISKEELLKKVEEYNSNPEKTTTIKLYEDELLVQFVSNVRATFSRKRLFEELKDFMHELDSNICSLQNVYDDIETLLGETDNIEEVEKLNNVLKEIEEIADRIVNDYDGNQARRMSEEAELILQKISEVEDDK